MKLRLTDVMMSTNGHGFGLHKPNGASVYFEFETVGAAETAREQIKVIISAACEVTIHGS